MGRARTAVQRALSIGSGVLLVGVFLVWMIVRNQPTLETVVGMGTALGWLTHIAALLVLLAGAALLARGFYSPHGSSAEEVAPDAVRVHDGE